MPRILFVTGRLAEPALRRVLEPLAMTTGFEFDIAVLPISVAALLHVDWMLRKLSIAQPFDRVIVPGWCQGDIGELSKRFATPFERGPKDLYDIPGKFGKQERVPADLSIYDIEILAEINHASRLSDVELMASAESYRRSGADVIDLGCIPGETWSDAGGATRRLRDAGFRVSIDSFNPREVEAAVDGGAELVLSVNGSNLAWAAELPVDLVAIPDDVREIGTLEPTIESLRAKGCRFRIDPILEPIGFGFAASLARYFDARRRWPDTAMMMGIGNLTELTEVDTAGVNMLLAGICQELRIGSVLTTEVINWARSAVQEFDIARRIARHAIEQKTLPKRVDSRLAMLRDPKLTVRGEDELSRLAESIRDPNFRILVERGEIHVMNRDGHWRGRDPYELFDRFTEGAAPLDASHAFYLGYELCKATTALTLGKQYTQDEALSWGFLTVPERSAHERRRSQK